MKSGFAGVVILILGTMALGAEVSFSAKPTAVKAGDQVKIAFTVSAPTDVEVAVLAPDGKVVRHLAAGVLGGKNAPPEPLKAGLAQALEWDGKDDFGFRVWGMGSGGSDSTSGTAGPNPKPQPPNPFSVRVRAGLGVRFDGFIGEDRHFMTFPRGLATDKAGDLYVYSAPTGNRSPGGPVDLQVFDRGGAYLRTLMPMPADLPAEKVKPLRAVAAGDGSWRPSNFVGVWPVLYDLLAHPHAFASTVPDSGALHFMTTTGFGRLGPDGGAVGDWFSREAWPKGGRPTDSAINWSMRGPAGLTVSPDGKTAYVTGLFQAGGAGAESFPPARVYRINVEDGPLEKFADVKDSKGLAGSALDRDGNLLVCDPAAGRVVVLDPKGEQVGEFKVATPAAVACHRKTGAVYVLSLVSTTDYAAPKALVKFSDWKTAKEEGRIDLRRDGGQAVMALDDSADPAVVWVATSCTKGGSPYVDAKAAQVVRLEERAGAFTESAHQIKFPVTPMGLPVRMAVHPETDTVICRGEFTLVAGFQGLTGKALDLPFKTCLDLGVGLDGNWYVVPGREWYGALNRYDRDLKPLPGAGGSNQVGYVFGRFGSGLGSFGIAADPKGRIYTLQGANGQTLSGACVVVFGPDGKPEDPGRMRGDPRLAQHDKFKSALVGNLEPCGGIALDRKGYIYVGLRDYPAYWTPPPGFEKDLAHWTFSGSVVKFKPEGGERIVLGGPDSVPYVAPTTLPAGKEGLRLLRKVCWSRGPVFIENGVKAYPGLSCMAGGGACACRQPMFQLDAWGRLFIPSALDCSVQVVDNEGNEVLRFGQYGNADSRGTGAESPIKKPEIPFGWPEAVGASYRAVYVADVLNRRVVRLLKTYAAEDTCDVK